MKLIKYFFFFTILYLVLSFCSTDYIHQTINGSLANSWKLNFSINAYKFRGLILLCMDSKNNEIKMLEKSNSIYLYYNNVQFIEKLTLKELCGYSSGDKRIMKFNIELKKKYISFTCNNWKKQSLTKHTTSGINMDNPNFNYSLPPALKNSDGKLYIMIGNKEISPLKDQMDGCLKSFYYNDIQVTFFEKGNKVKLSCPNICKSNICNNGKCKEDTILYNGFKNITCDCSFTPLNGKFCNRSMKSYNKEKSNSYKKTKNIDKIVMKLTWQSKSQNKMYCLIEFTGGNNIIWTNISRLMVDKTFSGNIKIGKINFMNVNIYNNKIEIDFNNIKSSNNFQWQKETKINVGYSNSKNICKTFEGDWDLQYDESELKEDVEIETSTMTIPINITMKNYGNNTIGFNWDMLNLNVPKLVLLGSVVCLIMISLLIIILYLKTKKDMEIQIQKVTAMSTITLTHQNSIFTETGVYGRVEDNEYDYIEDKDIYSTVNV